MTYWNDNLRTLYCGDAREILPGLPADYFHCVPTSPPYFGLRKYDGGESVWDGDKDCHHEWGDVGTIHTGGQQKDGQPSQRQGRDFSAANEVRDRETGSFCRLCGAWRGQLGAEPTPDMYIHHLVQIFQEVKRVLRPDGVCWVNIGDSWAGYWGGKYAHKPFGKDRSPGPGTPPNKQSLDFKNSSIKPLDMMLIPSRLAIALQADGWYVRSMPVWDKSNPMPESVNGWRWERHKVKVKAARRPRQEGHHSEGREYSVPIDRQSLTEWQDCPGCPKCTPDGLVLRKGSWRPTDSYEVVLMLTKTSHYYCDREAVSEISQGQTGLAADFRRETKESLVPRQSTTQHREDRESTLNNGRRNLRSVWSFPTQPGKFNHFAAFPPRLPEICIKASTSEKGCCPKCGAPWARVIDKVITSHDGNTESDYPTGTTANRLAMLRQAARERGEEYINQSCTLGWKPTCRCDAGDPVPCRVLDPFSGAGTTILKAAQLGRQGFGIDTSEKYCNLTVKRNQQMVIGI